jgi:hypothetical protein
MKLGRFGMNPDNAPLEYFTQFFFEDIDGFDITNKGCMQFRSPIGIFGKSPGK